MNEFVETLNLFIGNVIAYTFFGSDIWFHHLQRSESHSLPYPLCGIPHPP